MKSIYPLVLILLFAYGCNKTSIDNENDEQITNYLLPKALIITSGTLEGNGKLSPGISLALQFLTIKVLLQKLKTGIY
jgi:hypothetical protein